MRNVTQHTENANEIEKVRCEFALDVYVLCYFIYTNKAIHLLCYEFERLCMCMYGNAYV